MVWVIRKPRIEPNTTSTTTNAIKLQHCSGHKNSACRAYLQVLGTHCYRAECSFLTQQWTTQFPPRACLPWWSTSFFHIAPQWFNWTSQCPSPRKLSVRILVKVNTHAFVPLQRARKSENRYRRTGKRSRRAARGSECWIRHLLFFFAPRMYTPYEYHHEASHYYYYYFVIRILSGCPVALRRCPPVHYASDFYHAFFIGFNTTTTTTINKYYYCTTYYNTTHIPGRLLLSSH